MIRDFLRDRIALLRQVRRSQRRGMVAGVCVGLAERFGVEVNLLRFGWFVGALMTGFFPFLFAYLALWYLLDPADGGCVGKSPDPPRRSNGGSRSDRTVDVTVIKDRFVRLEERLRGLEACVSSREFQLRREIDRL